MSGSIPASDIEWVRGGIRHNAGLHRRQGRCGALRHARAADVRAKKVGHTVVSNAIDRPWSQYFCCMVAGSADYVDKYPVATKRVCGRSSGPPTCARRTRIGCARSWSIEASSRATTMRSATLQKTGHDKWREYDAAGFQCASMRCACRRQA